MKGLDNMSLNSTPSGERVHIGIFGKRNAGKSSVINALTGQDLAIVSDIKGTTTDPVYKAMELLPLGPVMIIDTPGLDDEGDLGLKRMEKAYQVLNKTDIALLVVDSSVGIGPEDLAIIEQFQAKKLNFLIIFNKCDIVSQSPACPIEYAPYSVEISSATGENVNYLKERIAHIVPSDNMTLQLVGHLLQPDDFVILVVPVDSAAPKGRLILPQQQTVRDILEAHAVSIVVQTPQLKKTIFSLGKKPKMVITDSQAFAQVSQDTPKDILLTSFSILFARYKGDLVTAVSGAKILDEIEDGDSILISEGCTHHRQCDDIGTVKMPNWIKKYTGKTPVFEFSSGTEFPRDLSKYKLVVHCGACMVNEKEMKHRLAHAQEQGVAITNYGIAIAYMHGILSRTLEPFPEIAALLK
jgi:[FeFe] hydrogenase H-cluster maturation GTPase HydF